MGSNDRGPVTIYTVAEYAGVSTATVSRVLQGTSSTSAATRNKVLDAVRALGYVPLRTGRQVTLRLEMHGLVMASIGGPYYSELLIGYESTTATFGQGVTLLPAEALPDVEERVLDLATKVDGMVFGHATVDDEVIEKVSRRIPVVTLGRNPLPYTDAITVDNMERTSELVRHLIDDHGYRRMRFVGDPSSSRDIARRYAGFLQTLSETGGSRSTEPYRVGYEEADGVRIADELVHEVADIDAFVCANDELALAMIARFRDLGVRVPDDVAITGWDDSYAARYSCPGLTTVKQPVRDLGRMVAQRLHERIAHGAGPGAQFRLASEVVLRGSCGCPEPPVFPAHDEVSEHDEPISDSEPD